LKKTRTTVVNSGGPAPELPFDLSKVDERLLQGLESHLETKSYIAGFEPTAADCRMFEAVAVKFPADAELFPHVFRWHKHIQSFGGERKKFPVTRLTRF
jgi:glutathione S-transferase